MRSGRITLSLMLFVAVTGCQQDKPPRVVAFNPVNPGAIAAKAGAGADTSVPTNSYELDGMVGQVNGRAIYASAVLEPEHEQLSALGRSLPPSQFQQQARTIIEGRLRGLILNALIYGEAEGDLTQQEQMYLMFAVASHREELLRLYGQGSLALAEENILARTGKTLEQTLESYRQELVVSRYVNQTLTPKINVSRRDIERYYMEHEAEFAPPVRRSLKILRVPTAEDAAQVVARLAAGEPFADVAQSMTGQGGSASQFPHALGDEPVRFDEVNQAMLPLNEGEHAGPIPINNEHWFVFVETIERQKPVSLMEAQSAIERQLRMQQFMVLQQTYQRKLLAEGSYNDPEQMADMIVRIAINRYLTTR